MRWSGIIIVLFVIFHLLDLTTGQANPAFRHGDVYNNIVASFSRWYVALFYILAMLALGLHLYHGLWSMFQTLGLNTRRSSRLWRNVAIAFAVLIVACNISIPLAVLAGFLRPIPAW